MRKERDGKVLNRAIIELAIVLRDTLDVYLSCVVTASHQNDII